MPAEMGWEETWEARQFTLQDAAVDLWGFGAGGLISVPLQEVNMRHVPRGS